MGLSPSSVMIRWEHPAKSRDIRDNDSARFLFDSEGALCHTGGISKAISSVFFADVDQMRTPSWSQSYSARVPQAFERSDHDRYIPVHARIHGKSRKQHTTAIRPAAQPDGYRHNEHQMGPRFGLWKCPFYTDKQHAILWHLVEENQVGFHVNH